MKRLSIFFLAFLTFWMSTWMVTDIHDWSVADDANVAEIAQPHPLFSVQQTQSITDSHDLHCGVCSYDHSGHTGQTLAALSIVIESIPAQSAINPPFPADSWYSRKTSPTLRPPIV